MMNWNTLDMTIAGLAGHYQDGDFTPAELVEHLLARKDDGHNIWIDRLDRARIQPYLDALPAKPDPSLPLFGIPFAIKDNIDLQQVDTTAGCEAYRHRAAQHATVVARLVAAGALPLGKTNLDQFATGLVGTRSPYGPCRNAFNPEYVSGGSSSGSAVATALGLVSFALGTDTAGSGRVPAAFNNLVGLKPSRGLISTRGVVPACRSLDCVSIFSLSVDDANAVLAVAEGYDADDPYSRSNKFDNSARRYGIQKSALTLGVPRAQDLEFFGDEKAGWLFAESIEVLRDSGHQVKTIDLTPLKEAATLLYQGPWVAERYIAIEHQIEQRPETLLPVIRQIIGQGREPSAIDSFKAEYRLQHYRQVSRQLFAGIDILVTPTAPTCYSIESVQADPINLNSRLGTYTNFMNLLDLCAVAVPAGFLDSGAGFGITLQAPALHDRLVLSLANSYCQTRQWVMGHDLAIAPATSAHGNEAGSHQVDIVVCGAHLEGMPLNWQLTERNARKIALTTTSPHYRLYAMDDGRPAMFRDETDGAAIEVEVWRLDRAEFGGFVADIPAPLGIGKVELADGSWHSSFIAEPRAMQGASDITQLGGWRAYCAQPTRKGSFDPAASARCRYRHEICYGAPLEK